MKWFKKWFEPKCEECGVEVSVHNNMCEDCYADWWEGAVNTSERGPIEIPKQLTINIIFK